MRYYMVKGLLVSSILGTNGLSYTAIFANCLGVDPGSRIERTANSSGLFGCLYLALSRARRIARSSDWMVDRNRAKPSMRSAAVAAMQPRCA